MYFRLFDCWRMSAALLVMTYHYLFWAPVGGVEAADFMRRLLPLLDMFFMISGFVITERYATRIASPGDFARFLRRRVARLYPLHFVTTMFFAAVAVFAWAIGAHHYPYAEELAALPYHLAAIHALGVTNTLNLNYVTWSVSAEFFSYAMFPLIVITLRARGMMGLALLILAYLVGLEIASAADVFPSGHWTNADTLGAYRAFADFMIGGLIAQIVYRRLVDIRSHGPGLCLLGLAVVAMLLQAPWFVPFALIALSLTATALAETARPESTAALHPLMRVTSASFGVYIWHPIMEFLFFTVLWSRYLVHVDGVNFYVFALLPMLSTIAVAMLSQRFVEPGLGRLIKGRGERSKAVSPAGASA
ncbi:Peptidoglycan/LPS O-acetylase OafA/YrhL, contains acyltransferase and SGNH-hydrolase domains [Fulvimarina manganoxydans]|uniref:Peptidoglycan/LPS O-acetylase OafA/YrhL, contains acyltransferase and SGNH-hydrolase domains n=1 Tax=Fulvimarina manganoxydans TaxID=937218 RepID=A0A1W2EHY5_9HYPH|nr:acyltransferase [Fulvimarina manganoxydans]SMD09321.1 Peptidoglycan/LPS O-acetylase OafA/YrhL, contains acyltransferase and SGNH-hydrolase domains [Fulvimarina manganoxydans]